MKKLLIALLVLHASIARAQTIVYAPQTARLAEGVLVAQPDGHVVVSPTPGVVLSVQPDGRIETRSASAIGSWELATRIGPTLLKYDGAGATYYLVVQEIFSKPPPPPPPVDNPNHIGPGPLSIERVKLVVAAAEREFPQLLQAFVTDTGATSAADEFMRRLVWHLQRAGFDAARQKNPSGVISMDKFAVKVDGQWQAVDIGSLGYANHAFAPAFQLIGGANPLADAGLPD